MKTSKLLSIVLSVLTALVVLTGSIAVPLLCRPFYYAHIGPMGLEEYGLSREQIETAYNHVRGLFLLDLRVFMAAAVLLAAALALCKAGKVCPHRFLDRGPGFWAAAGLGVSFLAVGGLAALDFDRAFVIFHSLFFPGKDNWIFDWIMDPIILFLPQDFFRSCAILILALLLVWCAALIAADLWTKSRRERR